MYVCVVLCIHYQCLYMDHLIVVCVVLCMYVCMYVCVVYVSIISACIWISFDSCMYSFMFVCVVLCIDYQCLYMDLF